MAESRIAAQAATLPLEAAWRRALRRRALAWYARHARDLPWRRDRDPYRVWVSEIMLQQTQVATVMPYFERFMAALPTIADLAAADEQQVLRLWEGLGYYRRARQMHQAARQMVADHGGVLPRDAGAVRRLPGIGRYTAGAILSIAFDAREPILEANTIRLWSRLLAIAEDPSTADAQRVLWQAAAEALPSKRAGQFNQALMELGSRICTPRNPRCGECPLSGLCRAAAEGSVEEIPAAKPKAKLTKVREAAVVVQRRRQVLLVHRQPGQRWAGLWDFPRFEIESRRGAKLDRELAAKTEAQTGIVAEPTERLTTIKHGVTRFAITLDCHAARYLSKTRTQNGAFAIQWLRPDQLDEVPLSTTGRKLARLLQTRNGRSR